MINHFNSNIAVEFSLNTAIFVQQLSQWSFLNLANKRHIHDGHVWSFNTLEAYSVIFPWWNRRQLETVINNAVKEGLVLKGNYNKHKYDRTMWYALTHKGMSYYKELLTDDFLMSLASTISQKCEMETQEMTSTELCNYHFTNLRNGFHGNVTPIPTNNTTNKNTPIVPKGDEKGFDMFWSLYPSKKGKKQCEAKWKKLKLEDKAPEIVEALKKQIASDDQWKRGFIPNPITYITGFRWEDEITKPRTGKTEKKYY
jgi:hypothetical protein